MTLKKSALLLLLVGVCALVPSALYAQNATSLLESAYSRVEDPVNDKTFLVVRFDLASINSETLAKTLDEVYVKFMKERGFNAEKVKTGRREFHAAVDALVQNIEALEQYRDALGVREVFFIAQNQADDSARLFIPGSQRELETKMAALQAITSLEPIKVAKGFALAPNPEKDAEIYKNFKPAPNQPLKRFFQSEATGSIQIFCSRLDIEMFYQKARDYLVEKGASEESFDEFKTGIDSFKSYFQQFSVSIDLNRLSMKGGFGFTTPERAEDARKTMEALGNRLVDAFYDDEGTPFDLPDDLKKKYNIPTLGREFARGMMKAAVPKRSDSSLSFELTPNSDNIWTNSFAIALILTL